MALTELQIIYIQKELKRRELTYEPLQDEILDHFCCVVEEEMENGLCFMDAFNKTSIRVFDQDQLNKVQHNTMLILSKKRRFMKFTSSISASVMALLAIILFTNASDAPSIKPFQDQNNVRMTSPFGLRHHPIYKKKLHHNGIDFGMPEGTPILVSADGIIIKVEYKEKGHGKLIKVKHDETYTSIYAQLSSSLVEEGQKVKQGEIIGHSGNSGISTASHLHYEILKNGKYVKPADYF